MNKPKPLNGSATGELCLACGLCCDGTLFADLKLQPGDNAARLRSLGLPLRASRFPRLIQPCAAFDGCRCRVYAERPSYCREFECVLLKSVKAGQVETSAALRQIRSARKRVEKVRRLLRELGDTEEHVALSSRFRRTSNRLHAIGFDEPSADVYGQLTLAIHELNFLLSESFYPGR